MAAIKEKDTKPEMVVRRFLWSKGFRYRLYDRRLPGSPDLVLRRYRTCVFVNGCFWHGHNLIFDDKESVQQGKEDSALLEVTSSKCCKIPNTNRAFWVRKMMRNKERDEKVYHQLAEMGWHSVVIWECELKPAYREQTLNQLVYTLCSIFLRDNTRPYDFLNEEDVLSQAAESDD